MYRFIIIINIYDFVNIYIKFYIYNVLKDL